jgi:hypothetical protein
VREVRLAQFARLMLLRKEHLSGRPFRRSPITNPAPQCPHLSVAKSAGGARCRCSKIVFACNQV